MKKYILIVLILILAILGIVVWNEYQSIQHSAPLSGGHVHGTLTYADAAYIQPWMTFDYLNFSYKLPPAYLQTSLSITSSQYPRISIRTYSIESGQNVTTVVERVINFVQSYIASSTAVQQH